METLHELLVRRHSIRRYTDESISAEDVKTILEAALMAPSSKSARPWNFILVENPEDLEKLSGCKAAGSRPIAACKLAVVICADPSKSDMYIEDMSVAAAYIQLQATALGLGACWIQVRNRFAADGEDAETIVRETLGIPENMVVECIITIGHPDEQRRPVDPEKLLWEKVHIDNWKSQD